LRLTRDKNPKRTKIRKPERRKQRVGEKNKKTPPLRINHLGTQDRNQRKPKT